jgi:hypothetical protein
MIDDLLRERLNSLKSNPIPVDPRGDKQEVPEVLLPPSRGSEDVGIDIKDKKYPDVIIQPSCEPLKSERNPYVNLGLGGWAGKIYGETNTFLGYLPGLSYALGLINRGFFQWTSNALGKIYNLGIDKILNNVEDLYADYRKILNFKGQNWKDIVNGSLQLVSKYLMGYGNVHQDYNVYSYSIYSFTSLSSIAKRFLNNINPLKSHHSGKASVSSFSKVNKRTFLNIYGFSFVNPLNPFNIRRNFTFRAMTSQSASQANEPWEPNYSTNRYDNSANTEAFISGSTSGNLNVIDYQNAAAERKKLIYDEKNSLSKLKDPFKPNKDLKDEGNDEGNEKRDKITKLVKKNPQIQNNQTWSKYIEQYQWPLDQSYSIFNKKNTGLYYFTTFFKLNNFFCLGDKAGLSNDAYWAVRIGHYNKWKSGLPKLPYPYNTGYWPITSVSFPIGDLKSRQISTPWFEIAVPELTSKPTVLKLTVVDNSVHTFKNWLIDYISKVYDHKTGIVVPYENCMFEIELWKYTNQLEPIQHFKFLIVLANYTLSFEGNDDRGTANEYDIEFSIVAEDTTIDRTISLNNLKYFNKDFVRPYRDNKSQPYFKTEK